MFRRLLASLKLTVCVSDEHGVAEADGDGETHEHEDPVDLGAVDLAVHAAGGVDDLDAREAAQCGALPHDREGGRDHRLASHDRRQRRDHQHRPEQAPCTKISFTSVGRAKSTLLLINSSCECLVSKSLLITGYGLEEDEVDVAARSFGEEGRLPHVLKHQARIDKAHKGYLSWT